MQQRRRFFGVAVIVTSVFIALFCFIEPQKPEMLGFMNIAYGGSTVTSTVIVGSSAPQVSSVNIDGTNPPTITLTANTTTNVNVEATITDNNGCTPINNGTTTILLYRSGVTSSSCLTSSGAAVTNLNCYVATAFTASSTCTTTNINTTTTFAVQYFAQATDAPSSSYPSQNWMATVIFKDPSNATGSADSTSASTTNDFATTIAINITTSSINYGSLQPSNTSPNQTTTVANAGNSSTTLQLSALSTLTSGANSITTSSQHYATSTFSYGGSEQLLSGTPTAVSGFLLTAPTSTTNVQSSIFWGLQVPNGTPTGTYNGVNQFTVVFSN